MTKRLRLLETKSAILLMVLMLISNFLESYSYSNAEGEDIDLQIMLNAPETLAFESKDISLLHRLMALKSQPKVDFNNKQYLKNRFWYFKPRRKDEEKNVFVNANNILLDKINRNTQNSREHFSNFDSALIQPQIPSSSMVANRNGRVINRSRVRRSSKYDYLFSSTSSPNSEKGLRHLESKSTAEFWETQKKVYKMYHRQSSSLLKILPNGSIVGESEYDKYCNMEIKAVDYDMQEEKTKVKIYGTASGYYIAMDKNGKLYTTRDAPNVDTVFLHDYKDFSHDAYLSERHKRYITLRGDTPGRAVATRAKRVLDTPQGPPNRARFLVSNVSQKEELPHTTASLGNARLATTTRKAPAQGGSRLEEISTVTTEHSLRPGNSTPTAINEISSLTTSVQTSTSPTEVDLTTMSQRNTTKHSRKNRKLRCRKEMEGGKRKCKKRKRKKKGRKRKNSKKSRKRKTKGRSKAKTRSTRSLADKRLSNHISSDIFQIFNRLGNDSFSTHDVTKLIDSNKSDVT